MAIKGQSYTKTQWIFEERPVSSAKLNQWDDRIEAALEMAFFLLNQAWGGGSGVLRGVSAGTLAVTPDSPESMSVIVDGGYAFVESYPFRLTEASAVAAIVPPTSLGRIDLVLTDLSTWGIVVKKGLESASPVAPDVGAGTMALAELVLRPGMSSIRSIDDGVNGYITDVRTFL